VVTRVSAYILLIVHVTGTSREQGKGGENWKKKGKKHKGEGKEKRVGEINNNNGVVLQSLYKTVSFFLAEGKKRETRGGEGAGGGERKGGKGKGERIRSSSSASTRLQPYLFPVTARGKGRGGKKL